MGPMDIEAPFFIGFKARRLGVYSVSGLWGIYGFRLWGLVGFRVSG